MAQRTRIPLSVPAFVGREAEYVQECLDTGWVSSKGRFVRDFEAAFAQRHGHAAAVSTGSGTAALHTALVELGIGPGDEVIVPALTFIATVNPVRYVGATPVFADIDPTTLTVDPAQIAARVTNRTKAIVVVHLYGQPADMDPILALGVPVIEDATEALGSTYRGTLCGTIGQVGCFSFNGNKVITTGGGGMILARDSDRLEHMRYMTLQAREPGSTEYLHGDVGFNYVLSNMQAALGLAQIEGLDERLARKRAIHARYAEGLRDVPGIRVVNEPEWAQSNFWLNSVLIDPAAYGADRVELAARLDAEDIETRPFFHPIHQLPPYREFAPEPLPVSELMHAQGLSLPSSPMLAAEDQARVIDVLRG
jgi:perosamine synthetase